MMKGAVSPEEGRLSFRAAFPQISVRVTAHLVGRAGPGGYARLTVTAPPGIWARAMPDSVALKRKTGRG